MSVNQILYGDCRESLKAMAASGVKAQTSVTSPPYYGLRDYGHAGQLGLEETPEQYIAAMVEVFRGVRDVLTDDGTLWVNIGDSYARTGGTDRKVSDTAIVGSTRNTLEQMRDRKQKSPSGLKDKDLIGIPWMLAFALRADGWYLRQDIIWHKPNPMPESVKDRCTRSHEYLFLLSKSEKYYFDNDAIKEPATSGSAGTVRKDQPRKMNATPIYQSNRGGATQEPVKRGAMGIPDDGMRNKRDVWTIATRPYKGAHFAVFPPALIEPCILAGSRPGDVVLDPFMGSGTTAAVAIQHGRQYVGCELNEAYKPLINQRVELAQGEVTNA
jgi:DNA modification methylase